MAQRAVALRPAAPAFSIGLKDAVARDEMSAQTHKGTTKPPYFPPREAKIRKIKMPRTTTTTRYDKYGRPVGYSESRSQTGREAQAEAEALVLLIALLVACVPVAPILFGGVVVGMYASEKLEFHALFAIVAGAVPVVSVIWLLLEFTLLRKIYFVVYAIAAGGSVIWGLIPESDVIWAVFFGLAVSASLLFYFRFVHREIKERKAWSFVR